MRIIQFITPSFLQPCYSDYKISLYLIYPIYPFIVTEQDFMCGQGEYKHNQGEQFKGQWARDKMNGHGEFVFQDAEVVYEEFKDNCRIIL